MQLTPEEVRALTYNDDAVCHLIAYHQVHAESMFVGPDMKQHHEQRVRELREWRTGLQRVNQSEG